MLSQGSQTQKALYHIIPFIGVSRIDKCIETENRAVVPRGWLKEETGSIMGMGFFVGDKNVLQ